MYKTLIILSPLGIFKNIHLISVGSTLTPYQRIWGFLPTSAKTKPPSSLIWTITMTSWLVSLIPPLPTTYLLAQQLDGYFQIWFRSCSSCSRLLCGIKVYFLDWLQGSTKSGRCHFPDLIFYASPTCIPPSGWGRVAELAFFRASVVLLLGTSTQALPTSLSSPHLDSSTICHLTSLCEVFSIHSISKHNSNTISPPPQGIPSSVFHAVWFFPQHLAPPRTSHVTYFYLQFSAPGM